MLLQLISDILDLAKIESGTMDFKFADMNVKEVINEIVTSFRIKMPDNVALIAPQDSPECQIYSDRMRLTQVISNFLNNAIKYTSEGCITLAYEIIGDEIKFSVTDTGDGMSQEIQAHIFDRFYKGNTFKQGTGLGLSICETIVNRLGGRIGVNSELGKDRLNFDIHIEYIASPRLTGKTLIISDPMLATGSSMELAYEALLTKGVPGHDFSDTLNITTETKAVFLYIYISKFGYELVKYGICVSKIDDSHESFF